MDRLIKRFDSVRDADLKICKARGVAYQVAPGRTDYGADYFSKVKAYDGTPIARSVNAGRVEMLSKHLPAEWLKERTKVLDWGAGSGAFVRDAAAAGFMVKGYDINPQAAVNLSERGVYERDPYLFDVITMWDTIEHMEQPGEIFKSIKKGAFMFASIPIFEDLDNIRASKHYRPGEHLYYWTSKGFIDWMALWGFRLLGQSTHEVDAGRESIGAFAFCRDLPDYHDHVAAYKEIHLTKHYGDSATEEYLGIALQVVRERKPKSILDYGCGRSDLVAHFWCDGERKIQRYDPAIGKYESLPVNAKFDLVFCLDVMEHIPMRYVDQVLAEMRLRGETFLISISTKLARAKLPDGRNAHVTILTKDEWLRWMKDVFFKYRLLPAKHEHELVLLAGAI